MSEQDKIIRDQILYGIAFSTTDENGKLKHVPFEEAMFEKLVDESTYLLPKIDCAPSSPPPFAYEHIEPGEVSKTPGLQPIKWVSEEEFKKEWPRCALQRLKDLYHGMPVVDLEKKLAERKKDD